MVFSSIPPYLDPSNYWHQQPPTPPNNHNLNQSANPVPPVVEGGTNHPHHLSPPPPPPPPPHGSGGSIRPGSMADRARQANIPMPVAPLKCPRCDSTNTKFCYFNNYNLSQPRHYCKTCRRYWTRGGSLRSVPVGGGCRRNKRSKGSSSKSPATSSNMSASGGTAVSSGVRHGSEILGFGGGHLPSLRLMPSPQYSTDFGEMGMNLYSGSMPPPLGGGSSNFSPPATTLGGGSNSGSLLGGNMEQLRLAQAAQFSFPTGSEPYTFEGPSDFITPVRPKGPATTQVAPPVKMEDNNNNNNQELNFSRQFLNPPPGNDHQFQWNTAAEWTDLSGFGSSSMSNDPA